MVEDRQITHLICVRLTFWGVFWASFLLFLTKKRPKTPPKKSDSKCLRRTQIGWIWRSSIVSKWLGIFLENVMLFREYSYRLNLEAKQSFWMSIGGGSWTDVGVRVLRLSGPARGWWSEVCCWQHSRHGEDIAQMLLRTSLVAPLNRLNAIPALLHPLDRYRTPSVTGSAIGRPHLALSCIHTQL